MRLVLRGVAVAALSMAVALPLALSAPTAGAEPPRSAPRGASSWVWDDTVALSPLGRPAIDPQIALSADGQVQTVAWAQLATSYDLYTRTSRDGGSTWDDSVVHAIPGRAHTAPSLDISSNGQVQGVVWTDGFGPDKTIRFARSIDSGVSWDDSVALTPLTGFAESPRLAMSSDGTVMSAVWSRLSSSWRIETRRTVTSGASWDVSILLNGASASGFLPWVAVSSSGDQQTALWTTYNDPLARSSGNSGATWDDSVALAPNGGTLNSPRIAMSTNGLVQLAVWRRQIS